jgi:flagellar basal body-associated protein FliL
MKNKGVSLIVLVITIIVIIILAGAVILSLSNNNPITQATEARFKTSIETYNSQLTLYVASQYATNLGNFDPNTLNAFSPSEVQAILTSVTTEDAKKIRIIQGKLSYIGSNQNEINWSKDLVVSLDIPYVKTGMSLWYDGIYNGGIGIHNDNTSANKAIWKDLSGSGNDGTLLNSNYDSSSGWLSSGVKCDGLNDSVFTPSLAVQTNSTFEMCFYSPNNAGNVVWSRGANTLIIYPDATAYMNSNSGYKGAFATNFNISNKTTTLSVVYNIATQNAYYYQDGVLKSTVTLPASTTTFSFTSGLNFFADYQSLSNKAGNIYSVRFYNRSLTQAEITQNYDIDKIRCGLN